MKKLITITAILCTAVPFVSSAGDVPVLSLHQNGTLIWTNSFTNALFTVEWASAIGGNATNTIWRDSSAVSHNVWIAPGAVTLEVPMFYRVRCQPATVRLGDAFFGDASDQFPTNSYYPMPTGGVAAYDGYGNFAGYAKTNQYYTGESFAGVKAVKVHTSSNYSGVWTADYWAACDILGNLRILKAVRDGVTVFEASSTNAPPVFMPCSLAIGSSWSYFGAWYSVTDTNASFQGRTNLLQVQWVSSFDVDYNYYQFAVGDVAEFWHDSPDSGWTRTSP